MSKNNTVCESNIKDANNSKKQTLTVDTNFDYFKYNYENAIHNQRTHFNWNQKRMFIPKCKTDFDFKLMKYDFDTGKYLRYYDSFEIEKVEKETNSFENNKYETLSLTPSTYISEHSSSEIINNSLLKKKQVTNCCCNIQ